MYMVTSLYRWSLVTFPIKDPKTVMPMSRRSTASISTPISSPRRTLRIPSSAGSAFGALPPPAARVKPSLECPVFGIKRPLSNAWGIRGPCGRDVPIERCRRDAEAVRDLSHADVEIGEHRLGGLDVVVGEFWRTASGAASTPRGGQAAWVRSRIRLRSNSANAPNM